MSVCIGRVSAVLFCPKKALQKVFFKPYKKFSLVPKIEQITPKMILLYILLNSPTLLISWFVDLVVKPQFDLGDRFDIEAIKYLISAIVCGTPISYLYLLIVNRFFVYKYATIVDEDNSTTLPVTASHDKV